MKKTILEMTEIADILSHFGLSAESITGFYDTSHSDDDKRLNYIPSKRRCFPSFFGTTA